MARFFTSYPFAFLSLALILGISFSNFGPWALLLAPILGLFYRGLKPWGSFLLNFFLILFSFFNGYFRAEAPVLKPLPSALKSVVDQRDKMDSLIKVKTYCQGKKGAWTFDGELGSIQGSRFKDPLNVRFRFYADECPLQKGDRFWAKARYKKPRGFRNPSSFDYPAYLALKGIGLHASLESPIHWRFLDNQASPLVKIFNKIREPIGESLQGSSLSEDSRALFEALLFKNKKALSNTTLHAFARSGLSHLLVVSGLHLGLCFLIFYIPFYYLLLLSLPRSQKAQATYWASLNGLMAAFFYAGVVGFSPSVLRSLCFVILGVLWLLLNHKKRLWTALSFIFWVLLSCKPDYFKDLGFGLSFLSVFWIAFFAKPLGHLHEALASRFALFKNKFFRAVFFLFALSWVIGWGLMPILANNFHQFSWGSALANLVFGPIVSLLILPGLFIASLISLIDSTGAVLLLELLGKISQGMLQGVETFSQIPGVWSYMQPWVMAHWLVWFLGILLWRFWARTRLFLLGLCLMLFLSLGIYLWPRPYQEGLAFSLLDVGQGESILLELPGRDALLIDGGGFAFSDFEVGLKVVVPELLSRSIKSLRAVVVTHADSDHFKGIIEILESFSVKELWLAKGSQYHPQFEKLINLAKAKDVTIQYLFQGQNFSLNNTHWQVLWPPREVSHLKDNNQSLVFKISYGDHMALLTGDLESKVEKILLDQNLLFEATFLKVAHHGSKTSSGLNFLKKVRPRLSLISAGKNNRFGFPHEGVIKNLREFGAVLSTSEKGQIQVIFPPPSQNPKVTRVKPKIKLPKR